MNRTSNRHAKNVAKALLGILLGGLLGIYLGRYVFQFVWEETEKMESAAAVSTELIDPYTVLTVSDKEYLNQIISEITKGKHTRAEKILAVHDWMVRNIRYDLTYMQHIASDTLKTGLAVCSGYSALFWDFMDALDIPCIQVSGWAVSGEKLERHIWNAVLLEDGNLYYVDVCWDDPIMKGTSDYPNGENLRYKYFLVGEAAMRKDHAPEIHLEGVPEEDYNWQAETAKKQMGRNSNQSSKKGR